MKKLLTGILILAFATTFFSCKKDNYAPPSSILSGHLLYNGDSIYLEASQVPILVYQYGFGKVGPVGAITPAQPNTYNPGVPSETPTFDQSGGYSLALFNGDYKIIVPNGQGPFMWKQTADGNPDTVAVTVNGNQTLDLQVTPYYMIRNAQINAVGSDSISATCSVEKIITDSATAKDIEFVALYVNKTQFVAGSNNIASYSIPASAITDMNNIQLGVPIPAITPTQNYVFARIGLKIANVEDLIFSPLMQITF